MSTLIKGALTNILSNNSRKLGAVEIDPLLINCLNDKQYQNVTIYEKHFTLDKSRKSFDHNISLNPDEFRTMIKKIRSAEKMLNKNYFSISPIEKENKKWMRRIIVAKNDININGEITMNNILYLRKSSKKTPIPVSETEKIIGKRVKQIVKKLQPIYWTNLE